MNLNLNLIFLPNVNINNSHVTYENKLKPRTIFGDLSLERLFEKHYKEILKTVVTEITNYINDEQLCNDDETMFPRKCDMTGEWYIGDITFKDSNYLSIETRFLGFYPNSKRMPIDDYLSLEIHFSYHKSKNEFIFNGIDSSCI